MERFHTMAETSIRKIAVRTPNWIGDAAMAVPALRHLAAAFADAEIVLLVRAGIEGLFEDGDFFDRMLVFERPGPRPRKMLDIAGRFADEEFDLAIVMPNSFESALMVRLSGIPRRIGYNKDLRGLLLTDPIPVPEWKNRRHEAYYYLNLVGEAERRFQGRTSVDHSALDPALSVSQTRQSAARARLRNAGADTSRRLVALGAGSTNSMAKRWGAVSFASLADGLANEFNAQVFLIGAPTEADVSREVVSRASVKPVDLTGKTSVAEAAALLSVADLLVSNDMGLAHVAPAVGTRTVVIFGPTDPVTTRPFSENATILRKDVECSPCMLRECPIDHRCMTGISVDAVLDACRRILGPDQIVQI
jgi:heptosyltransferase II